jgi:hypothetical protein
MAIWIPIICIFSLLSGTALASSIDLNANNDTVRMTYAHATSRNVVTDMGALFLDRKNNDTEFGVHAGASLVSDNIRFGLRAFYVDLDPYDVLSLGFGLQARGWINKQIGIGGHIYYAPEATSFLDSNGYREYAMRLNFAVSKNFDLYLGYRDIKVKILDNRNNTKLDDGFHLGFKVFF